MLKKGSVLVVLLLSLVSIIFILSKYFVGTGLHEANLSSAQKVSIATSLKPALLDHSVLSLNGFIENQGIISNPEVRYFKKIKGSRIYIKDEGVDFYFSKTQEPSLKMRLKNSNKTQAVAEDKMKGTINYLKGQKDDWKTSVPHFSKICYKEVYSGIDMFIIPESKFLKYEFHMAPHSDIKQIAVFYEGVEKLDIDSSGNLFIKTKIAEILDAAPYAYQEIDGIKVTVPVSYKLLDNNTVGFQPAGAYDSSRALVIDPVFAWSTYVGGSGGEVIYAVERDASGNIYIGGVTDSIDFPCPDRDSYPGYDHESGNGFIAKFTSDGSDLIFWTYLSGSVYGLAVNYANQVYVTGSCSSDFLPTDGAYDTVYNGGADGFVSKLSSDGNELEYSTFIGGNGDETAWDIAVAPNGLIYIAGTTDSNDFPTLDNVYQSSYQGNSDLFASIIDPNEEGPTGLVYSTYLGSEGFEAGGNFDLCEGDFYLIGYADSNELAETTGAFQPSYKGGNTDLFVTVLSPDFNGSSDVKYLTYFGGSGTEGSVGSESESFDIAVDRFGDIYITGATSSTDIRTTIGASWIPSTADESQDATEGFVAKLSPNGNTNDDLVYSTYIGGSDFDFPFAIKVVDSMAFVTGQTHSMGPCSDPNHTCGDLESFPNTDPNGPYHPVGKEFKHCESAVQFICSFTSNGDLYYSTFIGSGAFLGSSSHPYGYSFGLCVDNSGNATIGGISNQDNLPIPAGTVAFDPDFVGSSEAFLANFEIGLPAPVYNTRTKEWYTTIQSAINASQTQNGDTIIVYPGTYNETLYFNGKAITLQSTNPDNENVVKATIIVRNGGTQGTVNFTNSENGNSVLSGFTITGVGFGIYCLGSSPSISNCIVKDNTYYGIWCGSNSSSTITNCTVEDNTSYGIYCLSSSPLIADCVIKNNTKSGIYFAYCSSVIQRCTIENNGSYGIFSGSSSSPTVVNCLIRNNLSTGFRSLSLGAANFVIKNCIISGNGGPGIQSTNSSGSRTIKNNTIVGNTSQGIYGQSSMTIANNIIWGNGDDLYNCSATYSCIEDGDSGTGNISSNPNLTTDYHLLSNSLCIDVGNNAVVDSGDKDVDGDDRIIDGDGNQTATVDMGADEYNP